MIAGKHIFSSNNEKWFFLSSILVLLICIFCFAFFDNYYAIAIPFVIPFAAWIIINWKSFYWFYIFTIPFTVIISVGNSSAFYLPQFPFTVVLAGLTIVLLLYHKKMIADQVLKHPVTLVLALQYFFLVIAVIFSQIHLLSFKYLAVNTIQLLVFFLLPVIVIQTKKDILTLVKCLLIPFTFIILITFCRHAYHNFNYDLSNEVVIPFFYNHVDHGTLLSMIVPVTFILWRFHKGHKNRRWYFGLFVFYVVCTYLTFARAAILAMLLAFIVFWAIRKNLLKWVMPVLFAGIATVTIFMIKNDNYIDYRPNFEQTYSRHTFNDLIKASFVGGDMSSMERFYRWIAAVRMSGEHPFVGVGPNNFYYFYKPHTVSLFKTYVSRNPEMSTTHNYFLFLLVEQGWPAMLLYAVLLLVLFYNAQNMYNRSQNPFYKNIVLVCSMVIAAFFVNNLFSELLPTYKIGAVFYLAIVLMLWVDRQIKSESKNNAILK